MQRISLITTSRRAFRCQESIEKLNFCLFLGSLSESERLLHNSRYFCSISHFTSPVWQSEEGIKGKHFRSSIIEFIRNKGVQSEADKVTITLLLKKLNSNTIDNFYEVRNILDELRRQSILPRQYPEVTRFCQEVLSWLEKQQQFQHLSSSDVLQIIQKIGQLGIDYQSANNQLKKSVKTLVVKLLDEFPWRKPGSMNLGLPLYVQSFVALRYINFNCKELPIRIRKQWIDDLSLFSDKSRLLDLQAAPFLQAFFHLQLQPSTTTKPLLLALLNQVAKETYSNPRPYSKSNSKRLGLYLRGLTSLGLTAETLTAEQIHLLSNGFLMDWNQAKVVYPKIDNFYSLGQLRFTTSTLPHQTWSFIFSQFTSHFLKEKNIEFAEIEKFLTSLVHCQLTAELLKKQYPEFTFQLQEYLMNMSFQKELLLNQEDILVLKRIFDLLKQLGFVAVEEHQKENLLQMISSLLNQKEYHHDDDQDAAVLSLLTLEKLPLLGIKWQNLPLSIRETFLNKWRHRFDIQPNWKEAFHVLSVLKTLHFPRGKYPLSFMESIIATMKAVFPNVHEINTTVAKNDKVDYSGPSLLIECCQTMNQYHLRWHELPFTLQDYLSKELSFSVNALKGDFTIESFTTLVLEFSLCQIPLTSREDDLVKVIEATIRRLLKVHEAKAVTSDRIEQFLNLLFSIVSLGWMWPELNHHTLRLIQANINKSINQIDEKMIIPLCTHLLYLGFDIFELESSSDISQKSYLEIHQLIINRLIILMHEHKLEKLSFHDYQQLLNYLYWWKTLDLGQSSTISLTTEQKKVMSLQSYLSTYYHHYQPKLLDHKSSSSTLDLPQLNKFLHILTSTTQDALTVYSPALTIDTAGLDHQSQEIQIVNPHSEISLPPVIKPLAIQYHHQIIALIDIVESIDRVNRVEELREYFYRHSGIATDGGIEEGEGRLIPLIRVSRGLIEGEIDRDNMFQEFIEIIHEIRDIIFMVRTRNENQKEN